MRSHRLSLPPKIAIPLMALLSLGSFIILLSVNPQKQAVQSPTIIVPTRTLVLTNTPIIQPPTASPEPTIAPTSTHQPAPESFYIENITGHRQIYHLGCEAGASVDWANFFGINIYEYTFQTSLPLSDNPNYGFVGDINSVWGQIPPYAYGVYAGPVADLLHAYGLPAKAINGYTLNEVKQKLAEGKPIIAWVIGNMEWSKPVNYSDSLGRTAVVAPYEHVVILTGYNQGTIRYMTNGRFIDTPTEVFLTSWGVLGNMAVIHE
jgi:uncharacterized protein YvpB